MKKTIKNNATNDLQVMIAQEIAKAMASMTQLKTESTTQATKRGVKIEKLPPVKAKSDEIHVLAPIIKITEYKGQPIIGFYKNETDTYAIMSFGVAKAKMILNTINSIKEFVAINE